jgi:steroid delta-isomerase-like uncharacterized protein
MSDQLINAAKAPINIYNDKNWGALKDAVVPGFKYDEVASHRKLEGVEPVLETWKGWATAFPDSKATFHAAHVAGDNTVILEITWNGTHTGPMMSPTGDEIPATGKSLDMRSCIVSEIADGKVAKQTQYFDLLTMMTQLGLAG